MKETKTQNSVLDFCSGRDLEIVESEGRGRREAFASAAEVLREISCGRWTEAVACLQQDGDLPLDTLLPRVSHMVRSLHASLVRRAVLYGLRLVGGGKAADSALYSLLLPEPALEVAQKCSF